MASMPSERLTEEQFRSLVELVQAISEQSIAGNVVDWMRHDTRRRKAEAHARMLLVAQEDIVHVPDFLRNGDG